MTNKEKYILLCEHEKIPLHAQAWWMEAVSHGKRWDALILENADGKIEAAMPYHVVRRFCMRAILMPVHTQYHYIYIAPHSNHNVYLRLAQALDETCRKEHVDWVQIQGFYPTQMIDTLRTQGFTIREKITYRINQIPTRENLPASFSRNKLRQLRKAKDLRMVDMSVEDFYTFQKDCWAKQGKKIDYSLHWAQAVLPEAQKRQQGRLIAAQDINGSLLASLFLAWDKKFAYYLLPTYNPILKEKGGVAWLTTQAIEIAKEKGLSFDFEGSMTPSIASSYQQFGGQPITYFSVEKYYKPLFRLVNWIH